MTQTANQEQFKKASAIEKWQGTFLKAFEILFLEAPEIFLEVFENLYSEALEIVWQYYEKNKSWIKSVLT